MLTLLGIKRWIFVFLQLIFCFGVIWQSCEAIKAPKSSSSSLQIKSDFCFCPRAATKDCRTSTSALEISWLIVSLLLQCNFVFFFNLKLFHGCLSLSCEDTRLVFVMSHILSSFDIELFSLVGSSSSDSIVMKLVDVFQGL